MIRIVNHSCKASGLLSILSILLLCWGAPVAADVVSLQVRPGIHATADWRPAQSDKNPVLILHGFLQTYRFSTVSHLQESLADNDYPVLAPTLSLGINRRRETLGCEALHLHNLQMEIEELKQWVDWLYQKQRKPVVLIAHSAGGKAVTGFLARYPDAPVAQAILISFSYLPSAPPEYQTEAEIKAYRLGFCKKYLTTAENFNSYADWNTQRMIAAIRQSRHPVSIIVGSADQRIRPEWLQSLAEAGIKVVSIEGANHFFDNSHEFDLNDAVEELLESGVE